VARDEQGAREGTDDPTPDGSGGDADDSAAPTPHGDGEAADLQFYVLYLTRAHRTGLFGAILFATHGREALTAW
jgi:hypothetical protein